MKSAHLINYSASCDVIAVVNALIYMLRTYTHDHEIANFSKLHALSDSLNNFSKLHALSDSLNNIRKYYQYVFT